MTEKIRLLAIDIDGTLLNGRFELSPANRDAVVAAHRAGVEIALVTGRRFGFAEPIVAQFPIDLLVLASNGALVRKKDGTTLRRRLLPRAQARAVLAAAGRGREYALLIFDRPEEETMVAQSPRSRHPTLQRYLDRNRQHLRYVPSLEDALTEDPIQVLFVGGVAPLRELEAKLQQAPVARSVSLVKTEYPERDLTLLDALDRDCTKGTALARLAAERQLAPAQVMAIGDNWGDREMLEFAGLPVLMGNSPEALKERGWPLTATNNEDGVAKAIRRFLLGSC